MTGNSRRLLAATAVLALAAAGCSSSKSGGSTSPSSSSGASSGGSAPTKTIKVGVLVDMTGPAASGNKTAPEGVKAGAVYAAKNGYKIDYVVGDTATNPATALSAVQKMVTQDKVKVVIAHSALTFAASTYLTAHKVPVVGVAEDGPEWGKSMNMFSVFGAIQTTKVASTYGEFFKSQGVTTLGSLGYSISPSSSESAKGSAESAKAAGLKVGYLNAAFPFGSTNVTPVALAMKKGGVDGFTAATDPNTAFSLITALRQNGVDIKAALLPTGYGGDLLQAGPGALSAAQNVFFSSSYEPVEMQTPATKAFQADLAAAGITTIPTYAEYNAYLSVGLLVRGLKAAGSEDPAALITALSGIHDWDALGLFGDHKMDINDRQNIVGGADNCAFIVKLVGKKFELVKGATPICGHVLEGVTVSPSS